MNTNTIFALAVIGISAALYVFYPRIHKWLLARELKKIDARHDAALERIDERELRAAMRPPPAVLVHDRQRRLLGRIHDSLVRPTPQEAAEQTIVRLEAARAELQTEIDRRAVVVAELQADLDRMIRIAAEYFAVITAIETQRNNYKHMWLEQGREHAVGQAHYERALIEARQIASRAIEIINADRKKAGAPLISSPMELRDPPVGTVKKFRDKIEAHIAAAPPEVDGSAAQVRIGPPTLDRAPKEET